MRGGWPDAHIGRSRLSSGRHSPATQRRCAACARHRSQRWSHVAGRPRSRWTASGAPPVARPAARRSRSAGRCRAVARRGCPSARRAVLPVRRGKASRCRGPNRRAGTRIRRRPAPDRASADCSDRACPARTRQRGAGSQGCNNRPPAHSQNRHPLVDSRAARWQPARRARARAPGQVPPAPGDGRCTRQR